MWPDLIQRLTHLLLGHAGLEQFTVDMVLPRSYRDLPSHCDGYKHTYHAHRGDPERREKTGVPDSDASGLQSFNITLGHTVEINKDQSGDGDLKWEDKHRT